MKNLLVHLHPSMEFDRERVILARIQIDNSYELGWQKEDILLITNFPWEYNGIKSIEVDGNQFCRIKPKSTNTTIIPYLIEEGIINKKTIHWVHDFDACQLNKFSEADLNLANYDAGFTTYGWSDKWCLGSFFVKDTAKDVFQWIRTQVYTHKTEDERALVFLTKTNFNNINSRYKKLNITYNFGMRYVEHNYSLADKPIKVLHFHPYYKESRLIPLRVFMYGENELNMPLMDERLIKLYHHHGIR